MEQLKAPLDKTLEENYRELRALENRPKETKTYSPNGRREVERRLRQMAKRVARETA